MAAFTIVLLCIVIIPVSLFFAPSYSPSHDVPSYKLNQLYTREDGSSVTFDSASVSNGLFVDGKRYDGYYLIFHRSHSVHKTTLLCSIHKKNKPASSCLMKN